MRDLGDALVVHVHLTVINSRLTARWSWESVRSQTIQIMEPNMNNNNSGKNVLSADVEIKGNLKFTGELSFEGKLDGEIQTDGTLNLGDSAVINGNINAQSVIVRGKVTGNINAKEKVEIKTKAEL